MEVMAALDWSMHEVLVDLAGGPLSDWSYSKASLPCSLEGLGLRWASLHSPVTFIGSVIQSRPLVAEILGHTPSPPPRSNLSSAPRKLAKVAGRQDWAAIEETNVPLGQHYLLRATDLSLYDQLVTEVPDSF